MVGQPLCPKTILRLFKKCITLLCLEEKTAGSEWRTSLQQLYYVNNTSVAVRLGVTLIAQNRFKIPGRFPAVVMRLATLKLLPVERMAQHRWNLNLPVRFQFKGTAFRPPRTSVLIKLGFAASHTKFLFFSSRLHSIDAAISITWTRKANRSYLPRKKPLDVTRFARFERYLRQSKSSGEKILLSFFYASCALLQWHYKVC